MTFFSSLLVAIKIFFSDVSWNNKENGGVKLIPINDHYELVIPMTNAQNKRLNIKYTLKDQDIYVECHMKEFIITKAKRRLVKQNGEGHLHLYINNQKVDSIFTSAFIIKSLPIGVHKIRVELVHNDDTSYGIYEEFEVKL